MILSVWSLESYTNCSQLDYAEIVYIVFTGAIPTTTEKDSNSPEINSKEQILARLKNAEQQFRQASILVLLDTEKLELFTFYKKADIVKDQKSILTKFGHVCKLNHCNIAYKNACRIIELLKPETMRIYRLFAAALLSSVSLQVPSAAKVVRIGTTIYLIQSPRAVSSGDVIFDSPRNQYSLRKLELQVIAGGQLLLAVRSAIWPSLTLVSDLVRSGTLEVPSSDKHTFYLAPTGQLARYRDGWIGSQRMALDQSEQQQDESSLDAKHRVRCMDRTRDWISSRTNSSPGLDTETVWIEVQIPVLASPDDNAKEERMLLWKSIFWPAQLSYMFIDTVKSHYQSDTITSDEDPLTTAENWLRVDASEALQSKLDQEAAVQAYQHDMGPLFDDDIPFGSPQHFMSFPLQGIQHAQSVYPTPPEVMNMQPTPGISVVDGTAQTPATLQHLQSSVYQSSPLAATTDVPPGPNPDVATHQPLNHDEDEDEDLFDDMEDQKLGPSSFANEPNWDFFDRDSPDGDMEMTKDDVQDQGEAMTGADETDMPQTGSMDLEADNPQVKPPSDVAANASMHDENEAYPSADISQDAVEPEQELEAAFSRRPSAMKPFDSGPPLFAGGESNGYGSTTREIAQSAKRRRSSAHDIELQGEHDRDLKYATNGKYWFELKKQPIPVATLANHTSLTRALSSNSSSSNFSSQVQSDIDEQDNSETVAKPWARCDPDLAVNGQDMANTEVLDTTECDAETDELLQIVSAASGIEPFIAPMPCNIQTKSSLGEDPGRTSMVIQILNEQLVQSSLLQMSSDLTLPDTRQLPSFDISLDITGSNAGLNNASLGDLVAFQPANVATRPPPNIVSLDHGRVHLKQSDREITADTLIMKFWEVMNLQPLHGKKDTLAICIHPADETYTGGCQAFLRRLSETYTACQLGSHGLADLSGLVKGGLATWQPSIGCSDLLTQCQKIGQALSEHKGDEVCIVVYMIIPDDDLSRCYELCDAFVELYDAFVNPKVLTSKDVALQLVLSSFVASSESLVVPPQEQYVNLALEVYSRVPPVLHPSLPAASALAIELGEQAHPFVQFELDSKVASPLRRHGNCCHLAYSVSPDQRWLVAVWSDSIGAVALSMAYCLRDGDGGLARSRLETFKSLYEVSMQLMNRQKSEWWLAVVKVGLYEPDEAQEWLYHATQLREENKLLTRVVILNVELESRLNLHATGINARQLQPLSQVANALSTPVTTPQATTTSPEQNVAMTPASGPGLAVSASTPPDINTDTGGENDTRLVDPLEDSWMATFAFGLNQSHNFLDIRPALASGLLLKRTPSEANGGFDVALLCVNLVAVPRKPATPVTLQEREQILQEILVQYRGLHTMAVARRCIDPKGNCVPWHIASAYKGANILGKLL